MIKILLITLFFQGAYLPDYNLYYGINEKKYDLVDLDNAYYLEFGIDLYFLNRFFLKGSINSFFHKNKSKLSFYPDCDSYKIAAGIRYKGFEIGIEHFCFHPLFPFSTNSREWNEAEINNNTLLEGWYDKFYFNFELKGEF